MELKLLSFSFVFVSSYSFCNNTLSITLSMIDLSLISINWWLSILLYNSDKFIYDYIFHVIRTKKLNIFNFYAIKYDIVVIVMRNMYESIRCEDARDGENKNKK